MGHEVSNGRRHERSRPGSDTARRARLAVAMVAVGVVLAVAGTVEAGSPKGTQGRAERRVPLIRPGLDPDAVLKLGQAHALAKRRVETNAQCRALFTALGAAGEEKLAAAIYMQAPPEVVARRCRGGAAAAINPGTALTWVCPAFSSLKVQRAAMTLIHEALHSAGMLERPQTPDALSSAEINDLVRDSCGL